MIQVHCFYSLILYPLIQITQGLIIYSPFFVSICSDLGKVSAAGLSLAVEIMRFLRWMVDHSPTVFGNTHWDLLLCSMLAWLEVMVLFPSSFALFLCNTHRLKVTHSLSRPDISTPEQNQICILNRSYFNGRCKKDLRCFMADHA